MDYRSIADNGIVDYEIGTILVDYSNGSIHMKLKTPKLISAVLEIINFEEININRKEPWGTGIYVTASEIKYDANKIIAEIQLNSGDLLKIVIRNDISV